MTSIRKIVTAILIGMALLGAASAVAATHVPTPTPTAVEYA